MTEPTSDELRREILDLNKHGFIEFIEGMPHCVRITEKGLMAWSILHTLQGYDTKPFRRVDSH